MASKLSEYELIRFENIRRNQKKLRELGLETKKREAVKSAKKSNKKRRRPKTLPTRRSLRARAQPPPVYTPGSPSLEHEHEVEREKEIAEGWRLEDGRWRGECFGSVEGVPVGTVFGLGDFQRAGRFEMSRTGFFQPLVTPEWIDRRTKEAFSIILNNDNGKSRDDGDVILYAGSGGRYRGQNRTAEQSFHQTWQSATNAALRGNQRSGRPVRVIRGPKCAGKHGTEKTGGGYRYDGLYRVQSAEMVETGPRKLRTAFFELRRI